MFNLVPRLVLALSLGAAFACAPACSANSGDDHSAHDAAPTETTPATDDRPEREFGALTPEMMQALCLPAQPRGATDDAVAQLRRVVVENGTTSEGLVALATAIARKARQSQDPALYAIVDACAQLALVKTPNLPTAENLRILSLLNDHRFAEAKARAQAVIASDAGNQMAYGLLSDALLELGENDASIDMVQRMVDLKPNLPSYVRASYLAFLQGDLVSAKVIAKQAMSAGQEQKMTEPLSFVLTQTADIFWHEGDLDGALAGYDLALEKTPGYAKALLGKARIAYARGEHKEAVTWANAAFKTTRLAETAWLIGDAHTALGNLDAAAAAYDQLLRIGRHHDHRTLGLYLATTNQSPVRAVELLAREMKTRPGVYTQDAYALALSRAGRHGEAITLSAMARSMGTPDARLLLHAAQIQIAAGHEREGRALLKKSRALNPHVAERFAPHIG